MTKRFLADGRSNPCFSLFWLLAFCFSIVGARGQGTLLFTGGTEPVLTASRTLDLRDPLQNEIEFDFAFATDELPRPGVFLDSITATLQAANNTSLAAVLFIIDGSAEVFAPSGVSTLLFDPQSVSRAEIGPIAFGRQFTSQKAYRLRASLPEQLLGSTATFYFDLFDNGDSIASAAWLGELVLVPEPEPLLIGLAGLALFFWFRKRS